MKVFLAALIIVAFGVFIMCFNIIFRKKDFPNSDVCTNEEMRKRGIRCFKEIDAELHQPKKKGKKAGCTGEWSEDCAGCSLYEFDKVKKI